LALGGGWAEGRIANIVGDKSSGKTLLCIEAAANFILSHPKGRILYREAEAAFDPEYAAVLGMPIERVEFWDDEKPLDTVEDLFEDLLHVLKTRKKEPILYILDSLDSLSDRSEMERDMDQGSYGAEKAKKLSQLFRRLVRQMSSANLTLIIVSQIRSKIGVSFGRPTTRSGGRALDFYASQVLYLAQLGTEKRTIRGQQRVTGINIKGKVDKNKIGLPFREAKFDIVFGFGIDDAEACVEWLRETGNLEDIGVRKSGSDDYISALKKMPDDEYWKAVTKLREAVEYRWYEIETSFLPTRRKYARSE
jgi:recombination protein RecA